jgi:hypothetical protein
MSKKLRRSRNIESADVGLVKDVVWKKFLQDRDTALLHSIRKLLIKKVSGLTETFNKQSRYFGYWQGTEKDKAYIYVQKKNLRIDLCISREFEDNLKRAGFQVHYVNNYQGRTGWLTGWKVSHSATNVNLVVNWLCKVFEENL